MRRWIALADYRGKRDDVALDPGALQFEAKPAPAVRNCAGCMFLGQYAKVCREAANVAQRADLPDCEAGYVYKLRRNVDPRQLALVP